MSLTYQERGTTFLSTHTFVSGTTDIDPLNNMAYIKVYDSNGTLYIDSSGERLSSGNYQYYISTSSDSPLGIYRIRWEGGVFRNGTFGYMPEVENTEVIITTFD